MELMTCTLKGWLLLDIKCENICKTYSTGLKTVLPLIIASTLIYHNYSIS